MRKLAAAASTRARSAAISACILAEEASRWVRPRVRSGPRVVAADWSLSPECRKLYSRLAAAAFTERHAAGERKPAQAEEVSTGEISAERRRSKPAAAAFVWLLQKVRCGPKLAAARSSETAYPLRGQKRALEASLPNSFPAAIVPTRH